MLSVHSSSINLRGLIALDDPLDPDIPDTLCELQFCFGYEEQWWVYLHVWKRSATQVSDKYKYKHKLNLQYYELLNCNKLLQTVCSSEVVNCAFAHYTGCPQMASEFSESSSWWGCEYESRLLNGETLRAERPPWAVRPVRTSRWGIVQCAYGHTARRCVTLSICHRHDSSHPLRIPTAARLLCPTTRRCTPVTCTQIAVLNFV